MALALSVPGGTRPAFRTRQSAFLDPEAVRWFAGERREH
jgi:hypothetical protein